ncbi:MAG: ACT domain-containing protein [Planctomycetes bacterium]|nr:ACT domain-containing protein [Planctomycetota bacterium]
MAPKAERVEQISIFLKNRAGVVADLCTALTEQHINIRALTVMDTVDVGTLRMVVDDVELAKTALGNTGAAYIIVPVVALAIENAPGAFARVARTMAQAGVNIEYVYASAIGGSERSLGIFRVNNVEKALSLTYA